MKRFILSFAAALMLVGFSAGASLAQEVLIANGTGFTIQSLGLADSNASGNAQDLLGNDTLANGEGLKININGSPKGWELIAVDNEGSQVNWQNLDLTGVKKITLRGDGSADLQ